MNRFAEWLLTSGLLGPTIGIVMMYIGEAIAWAIQKIRK